jgi:hypothetical protein
MVFRAKKCVCSFGKTRVHYKLLNPFAHLEKKTMGFRAKKQN